MVRVRCPAHRVAIRRGCAHGETGAGREEDVLQLRTIRYREVDLVRVSWHVVAGEYPGVPSGSLWFSGVEAGHLLDEEDGLIGVEQSRRRGGQDLGIVGQDLRRKRHAQEDHRGEGHRAQELRDEERGQGLGKHRDEEEHVRPVRCEER